MKKICVISVVILMCIACISYAQDSIGIQAKYDSATNQMTVYIGHPVANPLLDYISFVEIDLNRRKVIEQYMKRQDNNIGVTLVYRIPDAKIGDTITITAQSTAKGLLKRMLVVQ